MFTGLVEATATVVANVPQNTGHALRVRSPWQDVQLGESIAINGVCLTVVAFDTQMLSFDVSHETLSCTTLATLKPHCIVNLERAATGATRLGGHYVTGHVDTTWTVAALKEEGEYLKVQLHAPKAFHPLLPPKGSLTVDGVSLTINALDEESECLSLLVIPHTKAYTNLSTLQSRQPVNIELDYFAKMVAHQIKLFLKSESSGVQNDSHAFYPTLSEVSAV